MGLKKANVSFTDSDGFAKNFAEVIVSDVIFSYQKLSIQIIYHAWSTADDRAAGVPARVIRQDLAVDLSDAQTLSLLLNVSDKLWELNLDAPFVVDFAGRKDGKLDPVSKTLRELGAIITDVEALK